MTEKPIIKIDNIVNYIRQNMNEKGALGFDDFAPIISPPFERAMFHYYDYVWNGDKHIKTAVVVAMSAFKIDKDKAREIYNENKEEMHKRMTVINEELERGPLYRLELRVYAGTTHMADCTRLVSYHGRDLGDGVLPNYKVFIIHKEEEFIDDMRRLTFPIYIAISFMHCKNVQLIDEPLTRQRRRKLERKGGIRYKVLNIEPFKKQVRRETQPGESQLQRALHICRGHFATYTEDKPLFGKLVGTYWKPMHARGNRAQGQVMKDYNIVLDS